MKNSSHLPACEDGTGRGFRNIGILNSDAGELPRRKHSKFRTWSKFEIKKSYVYFKEQLHVSSKTENRHPDIYHITFKIRHIATKHTLIILTYSVVSHNFTVI